VGTRSETRSGRKLDRGQQQLEEAIAREEERLAELDVLLNQQSLGGGRLEIEKLWADRMSAQARLNSLYEQWMQLEDQS
jgi:hypothetical protein